MRSRIALLARGLAAAGFAAVLVPAAALADDGTAEIDARASLRPSIVKIGEPVTYRGRAALCRCLTAAWLPPEPGDALTWSSLSARRIQGRINERQGAARRMPPRYFRREEYDTLVVEARLQVFRTGVVPIPGLRFVAREASHAAARLKFPERTAGRASIYRLPMVNLVVTSVLAAADSNADLRPVRGPIAAPWWERVPWRRVALGAVAVAVPVAVLLWRRRRARRPVAAAPAPPDPVAAALTALAALRGLSLPAHGRFAEHAFHLTRILRRFLEATTGVLRPGDTSGELLARLEPTPLAPDDLKMLGDLLSLWDRVKFARAPSSMEEALRAEQAVESLVRRHAPEPAEAAA